MERTGYFGWEGPLHAAGASPAVQVVRLAGSSRGIKDQSNPIERSVWKYHIRYKFLWTTTQLICCMYCIVKSDMWVGYGLCY
jgi:hypothetical protein